MNVELQIEIRCLRANEGNEEHETNNLEEGGGGFGEAEETDDDAVPEEASP